MILTKENLGNIAVEGLQKPSSAIFALPEKILQFGTGVLLRGLTDYFVDKANRQEIFNGRIVVVKSTSQGGTDAFEAQDGLFTHYIRGVEDGVKTEKTVINCSISRVIAANDDWDEILLCAASEAMKIIVSNTTEVGLTLLPDDDLTAAPPISFPGKLTAFLYARYKAFHGDADKGMVIIPTELIPDNGAVLRAICVTLATANKLEPAFIEWLITANDFCNSLVDRIVPGALSAAESARMEAAHGYQDALHLSSETYRLWAIETARKSTKDILSFRLADEGVIVTNNIEKYRTLKLRLLNGAHTFTCGLAVLSDFATVKEAMSNAFFEGFIKDLMLQEISATVIDKSITQAEAVGFINQVLDRFRNPFIEHQWLSITVQYSSKMAMRCVPAIVDYYTRVKAVPRHMAAGFGAYILFMRSEKTANGFIARNCGKSYTIQDDKAGLLHDKWRAANTAEEVVHDVLTDESLWQTDLSKLPGFEKAVLATVRKFLEQSGDVATQRTTILAA